MLGTETSSFKITSLYRFFLDNVVSKTENGEGESYMRLMKNILKQGLKRVSVWILREDHISENDFLWGPEAIFARLLSIFNKAKEEEKTVKSLDTQMKGNRGRKQEITKKLKYKNINQIHDEEVNYKIWLEGRKLGKFWHNLEEGNCI